MTWRVELSKPARKDLDKLPEADRRRVAIALRQLSVDPYVGDVKRLQDGTGEWRRRVGNWRIRFDVYPPLGLVRVKAIARRTSTTY